MLSETVKTSEIPDHVDFDHLDVDFGYLDVDFGNFGFRILTKIDPILTFENPENVDFAIHELSPPKKISVVNHHRKHF